MHWWTSKGQLEKFDTLLEIEMEQQKQKQADKKAEINLTKDFSHLLKDVPPHMKEEFEK